MSFPLQMSFQTDYSEKVLCVNTDNTKYYDYIPKGKICCDVDVYGMGIPGSGTPTFSYYFPKWNANDLTDDERILAATLSSTQGWGEALGSAFTPKASYDNIIEEE